MQTNTTDHCDMSDDTPSEQQLRANPGNQYIENDSLIWFEDGKFHLAPFPSLKERLANVGKLKIKAESSFATYEELLANIPGP